MESKKIKKFRVDKSEYVLSGISEDDIYFSSINENFEKKFREFCRIFLKKNDVALDVGANIGVTSIILSHYLKDGEVFAIEPGKDLYNLLRKNLDKNKIKNVKTYEIAISDKTEKLKFFENSAYGHLISDQSADVGTSYSVGALTLDDFVANEKITKIDFIKVDVEGFEPQFFRGALKTIKEFDPIIYFELNTFCLLDKANNNPRDFLEWIEKSFKYIYRIDKSTENSRVLEEVDPNEISRNLLWVNVCRHESVDDIVVTNNREKIDSIKLDLLNQNANLSQEKFDLQTRINKLTNSKAWRLAELYRRMRGNSKVGVNKNL